MSRQLNVQTLQIAKNTATAAFTAGVVPLSSQLIDGDVVVTNAKTGGVITSLTGVAEIAILQKGNGTIYKSDAIKVSAITSKTKKAYVAPAQEKKAIGYNGTTGSFPVANNTRYSVKVTTKFKKDTSMCIQPFMARGDSKGYAAAKQLQICVDLADNYNVNATQNENYVYANAITTAAPTAGTGMTAGVVGAGTLTVTKGSNLGVFATNIALETGLAVNGYVGILDAASKFLILKVKAIYTATNTVEFYSKYTGTTQTIATADFATKTRYMTTAGIASLATDAGIIFEAYAPPYVRGYKMYDNATFYVTGGANTSTAATISTLTRGTMGSGNGYLVADLEEWTRANFAPNTTRSDEFSVITEFADLTETYDIFQITSNPTYFVDSIVSSAMPKEMLVAFPTTLTSGKTAKAAFDVLTALVAL